MDSVVRSREMTDKKIDMKALETITKKVLDYKPSKDKKKDEREGTEQVYDGLEKEVKE